MTGRPVLTIRNWRLEQITDGTRVSADVGDMNVWFRLPPGYRASETGDAFLAVALIPAMALGADLDLTALPPVSRQLVSGTEAIQDIWTSWNPLVTRVAVRAREHSTATCCLAGGAAFFSGGVDALYTALQRRADLKCLIFINGFDFWMPPDVMAQSMTRVGQQAGILGLPVAGVETNWNAFTHHHRIARATTFGSALAAVGLVLAPDVMVIAASSSYARLTPMGSHPMLDPLWSTETTRIEHDGCHSRRDEKIAAIAQHPECLRDLWVCHRDPVQNCGECPKCIRLRLSLSLLGNADPGSAGGSGDLVRAWSQVLHRGSERFYLDELIALARAHGHLDAVRRLERRSRRMAVARALRAVDAALLGGAISRFRHRHDEPSDLFPWGTGPALEA